jgi:glucose/mannose-6-phosphate isomerase
MMIDQARAFGAQLREGLLAARGQVADARPPRSVVLCGLGGSAAGGRIAVALLEPRLTVPVVVAADAALPGWVDADTLVVVTSYSGETQESLAWFDAAAQRGARRVAIASGGTLIRVAAAAGVPAIVVRGGFAPRGALGLLLAALFVVLDETGVAPGAIGLLEPAARAADLAHATRRDEAVAAAGRLAGRTVVLYGSGPRAAVAVRLKNQLNENAKAAAFAGAIPEIAHNEVLGWHHVARLALPFRAVVLRDPADPEPLTGAITRLLAADAGGAEEWTGTGASELERAFSLLAFGDMVSLDLAAVEGIDPDDIARLTGLKDLPVTGT